MSDDVIVVIRRSRYDQKRKPEQEKVFEGWQGKTLYLVIML